jgi:hypothetical protein
MLQVMDVEVNKPFKGHLRKKVVVRLQCGIGPWVGTTGIAMLMEHFFIK